MASTSTSSLSDATKLAVERTRLAHERTLMAWVRTATSLISFGFTIYKFFEYLREKGQAPAGGLLGPRGFGIVMISMGLIALILATIEHRRSMKTLQKEFGISMPFSLSTLVGGLIGALGVLGLLTVALRQ